MFIYAFTLKAHFPVHGQEGCRSVCVCNKLREPQEPTSEGSLRVKGPWLDTHTHFCLFVSSADFGSTLQQLLPAVPEASLRGEWLSCPAQQSKAGRTTAEQKISVRRERKEWKRKRCSRTGKR